MIPALLVSGRPCALDLHALLHFRGVRGASSDQCQLRRLKINGRSPHRGLEPVGLHLEPQTLLLSSRRNVGRREETCAWSESIAELRRKSSETTLLKPGSCDLGCLPFPSSSAKCGTRWSRPHLKMSHETSTD